MEDPKHRKSLNRLIDFYMIKDEPHLQAEEQMTDLPCYIKPPAFKDILVQFNTKKYHPRVRYGFLFVVFWF
jgi:hypothetical protein